MTVNSSMIGRVIRVVGYRTDIRLADCELYCDQVVRNIQGRFFQIVDYDPTDRAVAINCDGIIWLFPREYHILLCNIFE